MEAELQGRSLSNIVLPTTDGASINLSKLPGTVVVFCYPRTSPPNQPPFEGWDLIPGARGCTPQACSFRDHHQALLQAGAAHVFGLSVQETDYQSEVVARLQLPYPLLSDARMELTKGLGLPTFEAGGMTMIKRITLILTDGKVEKVMYPVTDPAANAQEVIDYLEKRET